MEQIGSPFFCPEPRLDYLPPPPNSCDMEELQLNGLPIECRGAPITLRLDAAPPPPCTAIKTAILAQRTLSAQPIVRTAVVSIPTQDLRQARAVAPNVVPKVAARAIMENLSKKEMASFIKIVTYGRRCMPSMKPPSPLKISEIVSV